MSEDFDHEHGGPEEYEDWAGVVWTRKLLRRVPVVCCHCKKPLGDSVLQDEDGSRLMHVDCFVEYNDGLEPEEAKR